VADVEKKKIKLDGLQKWYSRSSMDTGQSSSGQSSSSWLQRFRRKKSSETQTSTTTEDSIEEEDRGRKRGRKYKSKGVGESTVSETDNKGRSKSIGSPAHEEASTSKETTKMVDVKDAQTEFIGQDTSMTDFTSGNALKDDSKQDAKKMVKFASSDKAAAKDEKPGMDAGAIGEGDAGSGDEDASPQKTLAKEDSEADEKDIDRTLTKKPELIDPELRKEDGVSNTEESRDIAGRKIEEITSKNVTPSGQLEGSQQNIDLVADRLEISTSAYRPEDTFGVTITVGDPGSRASSMTYLASAEPKLIHSFKLPFELPGGGFQQNLIVICPQDPSQTPTEAIHESNNKAGESPVREQLGYVPTRMLQQERDGNNQTAGNTVEELKSNNDVSTVEPQQERDSKDQSTKFTIAELSAGKEASAAEVTQGQNREDQPIGSRVEALASQKESALQAAEGDNASKENRNPQASKRESTVRQEETNEAGSPVAENLAAKPEEKNKQEENGSTTASQSLPSPIPENKEQPSNIPENKQQVLQMINSNPQTFFLAHSNKGTCNKDKEQKKQTGKTVTKFPEIPNSDSLLEGQELCEAVLAVWKRDKPIVSQRDPPKTEPNLRNHSREIRQSVLSQWKCHPHDRQLLSKHTGQDSSHEESQQSYRHQKFNQQEPAVPSTKVHSSAQESRQGILRSRPAVLDQISSTNNKHSTAKELGKEILYPTLKSPRFSSFYENCKEELQRCKPPFNEKVSPTRDSLWLQNDATNRTVSFADPETVPHSVFQGRRDIDVIASSQYAQVRPNFDTYGEPTAPSYSYEQPVSSKSKKVLSWDVGLPDGDLQKSPAKFYTSLQFPFPNQPRKGDDVLSEEQGPLETMPFVAPPGSCGFAKTMTRRGYEAELAQCPGVTSYSPEIDSHMQVDPLSSGISRAAQRDLSTDVNPTHRASDSSEKKYSQTETKSTTEKSTSCCQVQPPIPAFQSLTKDLPGIDWTPIHIESRLPLTFSKGKSLRSSLPKTEDGVGTPLRKASNRIVPCGAGESNCNSVGKKTYTPCFEPRSSFQKDSFSESNNSSVLSENSSSTGNCTYSGTPRSSSDNNSDQTVEPKEAGGISWEDSTNQEHYDGIFRGLGSDDEALSTCTSAENILSATPPLPAQRCFHKPRLNNKNVSLNEGEVVSGYSGEFPELLSRRSRSSG